MKISKKFVLVVMLIVINLNAILMFSVIFHGTSESTFEKLTGKPTATTADIEMCLDHWENMSQLANQTAYEGTLYTVDVNMTNEASIVQFNFSDNTSLFNINSTTGVISFTPVNANVGFHVINLSFSNNACNDLDASMIFYLRIYQTNFAPIINITSNLSLVEDVLFVYNVSANASDPDNDPLQFYDNTSLFNIDLNTGVIAFIPDNDDVGNHSVKITVSDGALVDDQDIIFSIRNVNDAPNLSTIGAQTALINYTFKLNITAFDVDLNENLTFSSDTSWFFNQSGPNATINTYVNMSLILNFTDLSFWNGTYSINVTVNDTNGTQDSEEISFTITYINNPPVITSYYPSSKSLSVYKNVPIRFNITKHDPDGTTPSTQWFVDDVLFGTDDNYTWPGSPNLSQVINITVRITDGQADDAESWIVTIIDRPPPPVEGTSVGGGGFGGDVIRTLCEELWVCTDWNVCPISELQIRECEDLRNCGTIENKPEESRKCVYVERPSCFDGVQNQDEVLVDCGGVCAPCPTCDDGIQNHEETGIDCGGPCPACKEVREPTKPMKLKFSTRELFTKINFYWLVWFLLSLLVLSTIRFGMFLKHRHLFPALSAIFIPFKILRIKLLLAKSRKLLNMNEVTKAKKAYDKAKGIYLKLPKSAMKKIRF